MKSAMEELLFYGYHKGPSSAIGPRSDRDVREKQEGYRLEIDHIPSIHGSEIDHVLSVHGTSR